MGRYFSGVVGRNRLLVILFLISFVLIFLGRLLMTADEREPSDFNYFLMTVLSTVGFGDITPPRGAPRTLITIGMFFIFLANIVGCWEGAIWN